MNKVVVYVFGAALLLSSCGTYTGSGALTGGSFGAILGSAIGGIAGGPRGSDLGTIIGMAGGAAVGAAIGAEADDKAHREVHEHYERVQARKARNRNNGVDDSRAMEERSHDWGDGEVDENNGGDDRLYDFQGSDYTDNYSTSEPTTKLPATSSVEELVSSYSYDTNIEIVNARFIDDDRNGVLGRGETGKIIFEVYNRSSQPVYDVQPCVVEADGNRHIYISPSVHVERIAPGKGIRYTAMIQADKKIKDGNALFCLSVLQGTEKISKVTEFAVKTRK